MRSAPWDPCRMGEQIGFRKEVCYTAALTPFAAVPWRQLCTWALSVVPRLCVCVAICCSGCHRGKFHKLICAVREAQFRSLLLPLLLLLSPLMISFFMLMIMPVLSRIIIHPDIRCSHLCPGPVRCHLFYIRCPPTHCLAGAAAREDWEPCRAFHRKCDGTGGSGGREKLCVCAERKGEMA